MSLQKMGSARSKATAYVMSTRVVIKIRQGIKLSIWRDKKQNKIFCYQCLKEPWHEIFDLCFFHQTTDPGSLTHRLRPFRIWLRIREDNRQSWLHSGVRSHIQKGLNPCIRGLRGVDLWRKKPNVDNLVAGSL
jgi:hypothetical protein